MIMLYQLNQSEIIFEFALHHVQNKYKTYQVKTWEWLIPPFFQLGQNFWEQINFFFSRLQCKKLI